MSGPPPETAEKAGAGGAPEGTECAKCGAADVPLMPDPEVEEVWFCAPCWAERARVTATHEFGYDNDFMEE